MTELLKAAKSSRNLAAIDIGTNSIRLLISNFNNSRFTTIVRKMETTRIGENLEITGKISQESAGKTLKVLSSYLTIMNEMGVKKYRAVGTSALRNAKNKSWFTEYIFKNLGIKIEPISGETEANFSFYGAVRNLSMENLKNKIKPGARDRIVVVDVGGGSSEIILGEPVGAKPLLSFSIQMGSVNLTERFIKSGKPQADELKELQEYIRKKLNEASKQMIENEPSFLICTGGTATTLAAIDLKLKKYDSSRIHRHLLSLDKIEKIYKYLCSLNSGERKKVIGLQPKRADIIISGTAILLEIIKMIKKENILISERDILDGIIYTLVNF